MSTDDEHQDTEEMAVRSSVTFVVRNHYEPCGDYFECGEQRIVGAGCRVAVWVLDQVPGAAFEALEPADRFADVRVEGSVLVARVRGAKDFEYTLTVRDEDGRLRVVFGGKPEDCEPDDDVKQGEPHLMMAWFPRPPPIVVIE